MAEKTKKIVPDTSIIIEGKLSDLIEKGKIDDAVIVIPEFVINELENQANMNREIGYLLELTRSSAYAANANHFQIKRIEQDTQRL